METHEQTTEPDAQSPAGETTAGAAQRPRWRRVLRVLLFTLGGLAALVVVLVLVALVMLQTDWAASRVVDTVGAYVNPYGEAELTVDRVGGTWITSLKLYDLTLAVADSTPMAQADTVILRYNPLALLWGRLQFREVYIVNPALNMRQAADGTWDLLAPLTPADTAATEQVLTYAFDEVALKNVYLGVHYYHPEGDSSLIFDDAYGYASELVIPQDGFYVRVDSLWGRAKPPGRDDFVRVRTAGAITENVVRFDTLRLVSSLSDLEARGTLPYSVLTDEEVDEREWAANFRMDAAPLDFADLRIFFLDLPEGRADVELAVFGPPSAMETDGAATFSDGGSVTLEGVVSLAADRPVQYDLTGTLRGFHPAYLTEGEVEDPAVTLNADYDVDLVGVDPSMLDGTVEARLFETQLGAVYVQQGTLRSTFDDGAARYDVDAALRGGVLTAGGTGRFFEEVPVYAAQGTFRDVDLGALLDNPQQESDLDGRFVVDGRGFDLETAAIRADLTLEDAVLNGTRLERAVATLELENGDLAFDANLVSRGGELALQGGATFAGGTVAYRIDRGVFEALNLAVFTGNPEQQSNLTGRFEAVGRGLDPETLTVEADLVLERGRYQTYDIREGRLDVAVEEGFVTIDGTVWLEGGRFFVEASGYLFRETPSYTAELRFENVQLGALTENPQLTSSLTGRLLLDGTGFDAETATIEATLRLVNSTINDNPVDRGVAAVTLRGGRLSYDVDFQSPAGAFALVGQGSIRGGVVQYQVREGRFENLNLAALTGDTLTTNLTGTFTAAGRGTDLASLALEAQVDLAAGRFGAYGIDDGTLAIDLRQGQLAFDADVTLAAGQIMAEGTARPFADVPTFEVTQGRFVDLDLSRFTQDTTQVSDLTGTFTLTGRGTSLADLFLEADIDLEASRFRQQEIREGTFAVSLRPQGLVDFTADVVIPEGRFLFTGAADLLQEEFTFALEEGMFEGLNLAALLDAPELESRLSGTIDIDGSGFQTPATGNFTVTVTLRPSTFRGVAIEQGRVVAEVDDGFVEATARVDFEEGSLQAEAAGRFFDEVPTYDVQGTLRNVDLGLVPAARADDMVGTLVFDIEGRGLDPETMTLAGNLVAGTARVQDVVVDSLLADFRLSEGVLVVDTLFLRSNIADATGGGRVALFDTLGLYESDFTFQASVDDLTPLRPFIGVPDTVALALEDGEIEGRVYGRQGRLQFDVALEAASVVYDDIRAADFSGTVIGTLDRDRTIEAVEGVAEAAFLSLSPTFNMRETAVEVVYDGNELALVADVQVDTEREVHLRGVAELGPENRRFVLEDLTLLLAGETWELLQPAVITLGDQYRISNFLLFSGDQQIALDGVIDFDGEQNLVLTVEEVPIGTFTDLFGFEGLGGVVSGSLVMTGPAAAPNVEGTLLASLTSRGNPVGDLRVQLDYEAQRMDVDALLTHEDGSTLTIDGSVPVDLSLVEGAEAVGGSVSLSTNEQTDTDQIDLTVVAESFAIGWIEPFLDPRTVDEVEGVLTGRAEVSGTYEQPVVRGEAVLARGRIHLPEQGVTYRDIQARLGLEGDQVVVQEAVLYSGPGTLRAEGTIDLVRLTLGELTLDITASEFLAVDNFQYRAVVSGDMVLTGTTREPVLEGDLILNSADIFLTEELTQDLERVELSEEDLRKLEQRFGIRVTAADTTTFDLFLALRMDLDVELARDVWLRSEANPEMDIQFTGDLDVVKVPRGEPSAFGSIEIIPERSRIYQFGKRFDVQSGTITFNGPIDDYYIDLEARYRVPARRSGEPQVVITLAVSGRPENLDLTLGSENPPGLPLTDIVSYIATGRPATQAFQLGGASDIFIDPAAGLALNEIAGIIEGAAGAELGLDVIEIETLGFQAAVLTAGKYVTQDLFVAVSQPIAFSTNAPSVVGTESSSGTQVTVEYSIYQWLLLRMVREGSLLRTNLLWQYAY